MLRTHETKSGKSKIDSESRSQVSKRAKKGKLMTIDKFCPNCGHDKAFTNFKYVKCTRCKVVNHE